MARGNMPRTPMFRGYPHIIQRPLIPFGLDVQRPLIPFGLDALYAACRQIYPDQTNPLQVTARLKFWLGGPDPLDYISMYSNPGDPATDIEPHWHYVSFGLSDLHGDGRVHEISADDSPSGFGFELTFRLKREPNERGPPTWPAAIMQALAKYVFQSENTLYAGDHVSWHCPLDNSDSRIQHMLMCEDPQLGTVMTPFGPVVFVQIVGVCNEELQAAQHWNGPGVIDLMKSINGAGGPWLITDMKRDRSIFEMDSNVQTAVDQGVANDGSNLTGVCARCSWTERKLLKVEDDEESELERGFSQISVSESEQIKATLKKGLINTKAPLPPIRQDDNYSNNDDNQNRELFANFNGEMPVLGAAELMEKRFLEGVHLKFNLEAGSLLSLVLQGRLKHGRHFTFKSVVGDTIITFVPVNVTGAFVDEEHPYAAHGPWLHVLLKDEDIECMLAELTELFAYPKTFEWCDRRLIVTLMHEDF